jgi:hypothetical protein
MSKQISGDHATTQHMSQQISGDHATTQHTNKQLSYYEYKQTYLSDLIGSWQGVSVGRR